MFKHLFICAFALLGLAASAQPYTGRVYQDANGNGTFDSGDKPLAGVRVSDGINVVETSKDGTFSLPGYDDMRFVFVTVPSGYYTVKPWIKAGDAASYDFAMIPRKTGETVRFVQIADNETTDGWKWIDAIRGYSKNENVDFIIHTGDICYEPGIRFNSENVNTSTMGVPMYYTMGNHDLMKRVPKAEYIYEQYLGPVWYSFEVNDVHFIVLPMYIGDGKPSYTAEQTYRWLKNDLAATDPAKKVIVFTHYDATLHQDELTFKSKEGNLDFKEHNIIAEVMGHLHINHQMLIDGKIRYILTSPSNQGGVDHAPTAFRVVTVDKKGNVTTENVYTYSEMDMAIVSPGNTAASSGLLNVSVNAYNTTAQVKSVSYVITDGKKTLSKGTLKKNTDWNYSLPVKAPKAASGDSLTLKATAVCSDGTTKTVERRFALGTLPAVKVEGQWAQFRGNEMHNEAITTNKDVKSLKLLWTANAGGNVFMASPIVAEGKVFTATMDNNLAGRSLVVAFDASTGAKVWSYPTANSVKNTIVYSSGKVFACDCEGTVYALDAATGALAWKKKLDVAFLPCVDAGLVVRGDTLYAGEGYGLSAINGANGEILWKNEGYPQACATAVTLTLAGNVLISSAQWDGLYGSDIKTGKVLWKLSGPDMRYRDGAVSVYDGKLYLASYKKLYEFNAKGEYQHVRHIGKVFDGASSPLITDSLFIIGTYQDGLMAFDKENFDLRWQCETGPAVFYTGPYSWHEARTVDASAVQVGKDAFLFGASDGLLRLASLKDGKVRWSYDFATPILTTPAYADGVVYIADFAGNVCAFAL